MADVTTRWHGGWFWFFGPDGGRSLDPEDCGKWMWFFRDQAAALDVCLRAVREGACVECKCSDLFAVGRPTGVACFYVNGSDVEGHRRVLSFLTRHGLVPRTSSGGYEDVPFKYDRQTRAGEYGDGFVPKLTLSDFMDPRTGDFLA